MADGRGGWLVWSWRMDGLKASCVANHGVVDGDCSSAAAGLWCVLKLPVVSEANGVSELSLVKKESMVREWGAVCQNEDTTARSTQRFSCGVIAVCKCPLPAGPDVVGFRSGWSSSDCESD